MKKKAFILQLLIFFSVLYTSAAACNLNPDSLCDIVIMKNGDEVKSKVLEITPVEIKYKRCLYDDGPLYIVKKYDVFMIKYANGTKEVFKDTNQMSDNNVKAGEEIKTKEELEHIKRCESNKKMAHRILLPIAGFFAALYITGIILSSQ